MATTTTATSHHGALVIFGSGPGIGVHVASRFVRGGFEKVVLLSRNSRRLSDDAFIVYSNAPHIQVSTVTVDLTKPADLGRALHEIEFVLAGTPVECVHFGMSCGVPHWKYTLTVEFLELTSSRSMSHDILLQTNAANTDETWLLDASPTDLRTNLELSVVALYTVSQWAVPRLLQLAGKQSYKPALITTSGWLSDVPEPNYFALGVCKSAQQNIIHSLHDQLRPHRVHCGLVMVDNQVSQEARNTNPANIAEESWKLYSSQGSGNMELETHIREDGGHGHPSQRFGT